MNLPNKLTLVRAGCIPLIILFLSIELHAGRWISLILFILASLTDFLDGYIARKKNLITDFGKFLDPVADKILVLSTMIMLIHLQLLPAWFVVIILARELSVDGLRMIAVRSGKVIAAGQTGKIKTFSQMILIIVLLFLNQPVFSRMLLIVMGIWVLGITLYSGVEYFVKNTSVLSLKQR